MRDRARLRWPVSTVLLFTLNTVIYIWLAFLSGNALVVDESIVSHVAQWNVMVLYEGAYWQLLTAMFVHFNLLHLALNMLFLVQAGLSLEPITGSAMLLLAYLASGLFGNLLTLALGPNLLSAGSSGAVLGVYAALLVVSNRFFERGKTRSLIQIAILFTLNSILPGVNVMSHLGGIACGAAIGFLETKRRPPSVTATSGFLSLFLYSPGHCQHVGGLGSRVEGAGRSDNVDRHG